MKRLLSVLAASLMACSSYAEAANLRVIDGDTIVVGKTRVRSLGYDTPEIGKGPHGYKCAAELALGLKAKARFTQLISPPNVMTLKWSKDKDEYGRSLATVYSNHKAVGPILISEGLAHPYNGRNRKGWC